jgi:hypothetical protein
MLTAMRRREIHLHRCPSCGVPYRCATMEDEPGEVCIPTCFGCDIPAHVTFTA